MKRGLLIVLSAAALVAAADVELDFSPRRPGAVYDRLGEKRVRGFARVENAWGRRLGDAMDVTPRFVYPEYATDRRGGMNALRLGSALSKVPGSKPAGLKTDIAIPTDRPSTQLLWFYVYDQPVQGSNISLLYAKFGWAIGFRCSWERAHWSPEGHVSCCIGIGKAGSCGLSGFGKYEDGTPRKTAKVNEWHQLAIVLDGKTAALYMDGTLMDRKDCGFYRDDGKNGGLLLSLAETGDCAYFKTDFYGLYERAFTADEIAADWRKGAPKAVDEKTALAHWNSISIPTASCGYFRVGERIPLSVDGKVVKTYAFDKPGLYEIERDGKRIPVGIAPELPDGRRRIGMADLMNRQPEALALGVGGTVVKVPHWLVEPRKDEFDWTALDRFTDACAAKAVKVYFIPQKGCSEKLRKYLNARYDNARVVEDEKTFTFIDGFAPVFAEDPKADKENAKKLVTALFEARIRGDRNIVVRSGPTVWCGPFAEAFAGRPSWRGIAFGWFNARFGGKEAPTEADKRDFLSKLDAMLCQ